MIRTITAILLLATTAHAEAPSGTNPNSPVSQWYQSLTSPKTHISCCSSADCRVTRVQRDTQGRVWAYISREQYGTAAPDDWVEIPPGVTSSQDDRPASVHGPVVCWRFGTLMCADLEAGG